MLGLLDVQHRPRCAVAPFVETVGATTVGIDIGSRRGFDLPPVSGGSNYGPLPSSQFAGLATNLFCGGVVRPGQTEASIDCSATELEARRERWRWQKSTRC